MSKHDLSKLFSGTPSAQLEFVSAKPGPFTGKRLKLATNDRPLEGRPASLSIAEFAERNGTAFYSDTYLAEKAAK